MTSCKAVYDMLLLHVLLKVNYLLVVEIYISGTHKNCLLANLKPLAPIHVCRFHQGILFLRFTRNLFTIINKFQFQIEELWSN